jgi:putative copper resistance protein D
VAFGLGLVVLLTATQGPVAAADTRRLSVHMVQHVLLGMVAPLLLALSAPLTLALQTGGPGTRSRLRRALHSRPARLLANPLIGMTLFGASLFALYFTPLLALSLRSEPVHAAVHLHFFAAGAIFLWPVIGTDPVVARPSHPVRLLAVFLTLPLHAILGLAVLGSDRLLAGGWYGRALGPHAALSDQHAAAGLLWAAGEIVGLACAALVLARWMAADEREAVRSDRRLDRLAAAEGA